MLISPNYNSLPCIYNAQRNIAQASESTKGCSDDQHSICKRNYPFQRSYLHTSFADTDANNITNKVEPLRNNLVGQLINIYA